MKRQVLEKVRQSNSGFSLVELIVAVSILVLVSIPFALAFITATRINGASRDVERATVAGNTEMEYLRSSDILSFTTAADSASGAVPVTLSSLTSGASTSGAVQGTLLSNKEKFIVGGSYNASSYEYSRAINIDGRPFYISAELNPFRGSGASGADTTDYNTYFTSVAQPFPVITANTGQTNLTDANFAISDETNIKMINDLADYHFPDKKATADLTSGAGSTLTTIGKKRVNSMIGTVSSNLQRKIEISIENSSMSEGGETYYKTEVYAQATYTYLGSTKTYAAELPRQCIYSNKMKADATDPDKHTNLSNIYLTYKGSEYSTTSRPRDLVYIYNNNNSSLSGTTGTPLNVNVYIVDSSKRPNYGLNIYTRENRSWASITPSNIKDNIVTSLIVLKSTNANLFYAEGTGTWQRGMFHNARGLFNVSDIVNYKQDSAIGYTSSDGSPIYNVTLNVYRGNSSGGKALVTLKSKLQ